MQARFPFFLCVTPDQETVFWRLDKPFWYRSRFGIIEVPAGFKTDFASIPPVCSIGLLVLLAGYSIPSLFWLGVLLIAISPKLLHTGSYSRAAVIHDYIYKTRMFCRKNCDGILYEAMGDCGTAMWKRLLIWANVRMFGWMFY
jgi:Protein of unknown function (DUF1353)